MGWIAQEYEGDAHMVPDTEPGHVLAVDCFCEPTTERVGEGLVVVHRDHLARDLERRLVL